jgi:ketosteroid isomerase-like protein
MSASPQGPSPELAARAYFDAIHAGDVDRLADVFSEDAVLRFPTLDQIAGREAIRGFYSNVFTFYTRRDDSVTRWFHGEDSVAAEIHFEGHTNTGKDVVFDAVDVFTVSGGKITRLEIFYDSARVLQMLGTLPSQS